MGGADDTEVGDIVEVDGEGEIMIEEGVADVVRDVLAAFGDVVEDEAGTIVVISGTIVVVQEIIESSRTA